MVQDLSPGGPHLKMALNVVLKAPMRCCHGSRPIFLVNHLSKELTITKFQMSA